VDPSAPPRGRRLHPLVADGCVLLLLLALVGKLTWDLSRVRDLEPSDEAVYMSLGLGIPQHGLPGTENCPLYCLWYYLLSWLQPDPLRLFYFSAAVLTALLTAGVYLLLRAAGGTRFVSLLAAFVLLTSGLMEIRPYPTYLVLVLLLFGTALAVRVCRPAWSGAILALALLLTGYARSEYYTAFLLFCLVGGGRLVWAWLRRPAARRTLAAAALVVALAAGVLGWTVGVPFAAGGGRSFIAFGQHYALNVVVSKKLPVNPWVHFVALVRQDFGDAQTFGQALCANPRAVLRHVALNACSLPGALVRTVAPDLDLPTRGFVVLCVLLAAAAVAGIIALGYRLFFRPPDDPCRRGLLLALVMTAFALVPVLAAALLLWPCDHYLMPLAVFFVVLTGASLPSLPGCRGLCEKLDSRPALLALGTLLLVAAPNRAHGWDVQRLLWRQPLRQANPILWEPIARALHDLRITAPVNLLDYAGDARAFYAGLPCRVVAVQEKTGDFRAFLRRRDVGVVVIDPGLLSDVCYRDDPSFKDFVAGKQTDDFRLFRVPHVPVKIAVRRDLLPH
jgi:hypothetical protein